MPLAVRASAGTCANRYTCKPQPYVLSKNLIWAPWWASAIRVAFWLLRPFQKSIGKKGAIKVKYNAKNFLKNPNSKTVWSFFQNLPVTA
jgi:hypothetical protein